MPFGAVPTTGPFATGVDLMFTPGRCKKTISWFSHGGTVCGVVVGPAAASGPAWGDAATFTEGATSDPAAADGSGDSSGVVGAAWTGVSSADCTAVGGDFRSLRSYVFARLTAPRGSTQPHLRLMLPQARYPQSAFALRRNSSGVRANQLAHRDSLKACSSLVTGPRASRRRRLSPEAGAPVAARGGGQSSAGWPRMLSANLSPLSRASLISPIAMLPPTHTTTYSNE